MANAFAWCRKELFLGLILSSCSPASDIPDLDYHRGRNALALERYDWARVYLASDWQRNPARLESLRSLGIAWFSGSERSLSKAIDHFDRYLRLAPDDHDIRLRLARASLLLADEDGALATLAETPESLHTNLLMARAHLDRDPAIARQYVARALEAAPDQLAPHLLAARIYSRLGDDAKAASHAARAAAVDPLHDRAHYVLATALRRLGSSKQSQLALDRYELLRRLSSFGLPRSEELGLLERLQDELEAESSVLRLRLSRLWLETGRFEAAALAAREVAADPGCDPATLFGLAQAARAAGRMLLATDLYHGVLERSPAHRGALTQLARLAYDANDLDQSRAYLETGFTEDPFHAPFHFIHGLIALSERREDAATESLQAAVDLAPWVARYRIAFADLLLSLGEREAFDRLLAAAPALDPVIDTYRKKHRR